MDSKKKHTFHRFIEWGSLVCAVIALTIRADYYPWINIVPALLVLSWAARRMRAGRFTRSTPVDLPIIVFIISILVAFWAAPIQADGLVRLYQFATAISILYGIVNADRKSLQLFALSLIAAIAVFGLFLTGQYDWTQIPGRFGISRQAGRLLGLIIPNLSFNLPQWNITRNILASLYSVGLPVAMMVFMSGIRNTGRQLDDPSRERRNRSNLGVWVPGLILAAIIAGLIITESRTPWVIFGLGFIVWVWWMLSGIITSRIKLRQINVFLIGLGIAVIFIVLVFVGQSLNNSLISKIPGPQDYLLRGEFYPQAWRLSQDTPLSGGGLAASPDLYSTYIQVVPFYTFAKEDNAINAYLNILVEQGWLGLISYVLILIISLFTAVLRLLKNDGRDKNLVVAGLLGVGFILVYGFVHSALSATRAIPALFIPAGLALSSVGHITQTSETGSSQRITKRNAPTQKDAAAIAIVLISMLLIPVLTVSSLRRSLISRLYSNLGAVEMARIDLEGFPTREWADGSQAGRYATSAAHFEKALQYDQNNRTAYHSLGLIAMLDRDYSKAAALLDRAHQLDPLHRGIIKNLGYSYVWSDQPEPALSLLASIPEASSEMAVYAGWWNRQGRDDLAARAEQMVNDLQP